MRSLLPILLLTILTTLINGEEEVIQSIEIDATGQVKQEETPKHPNALEVIFENQSGRTVELYWDDSKDGILQGTLDHTNQITINTFLGHRFYYTPKDSSGSKDQLLYEITMEVHTGLITLYDEKTMKERGAEFERKRSLWFKEYYDRTGKRWQNYYPRDPITHHYYDIKETGETISVSTARTKFKVCDPEQLTADDMAKIDEMEREWLSDEKNTKVSKKCEEDPDDEGCHKAPPSFQIDNDRYYVGKMNDTLYCRDKVSGDGGIDGVDNDTYTIINICAHGPHAFRIFDFLSDDEMEHIKLLGQHLGMKRSTVSEEATVTVDRTSRTVWLERDKSFIIDNVIRRIADMVNVPQDILFLNSSSESLQLVHYEGGELYKSHVDYGTDRPHNRFITYLMYLHEVAGGGNTSFPKADKRCRDENNYFGVQPVKGSVMFFYNLYPDGNVDPLTQHYAEPPTNGSQKWMTNLWIWDKVFTR